MNISDSTRNAISPWKWAIAGVSIGYLIWSIYVGFVFGVSRQGISIQYALLLNPPFLFWSTYYFVGIPPQKKQIIKNYSHNYNLQGGLAAFLGGYLAVSLDLISNLFLIPSIVLPFCFSIIGLYSYKTNMYRLPLLNRKILLMLKVITIIFYLIIFLIVWKPVLYFIIFDSLWI